MLLSWLMVKARWCHWVVVDGLAFYGGGGSLVLIFRFLDSIAMNRLVVWRLSSLDFCRRIVFLPMLLVEMRFISLPSSQDLLVAMAG